MNKERIVEIGKFLETRLFIHRQVEHNDKWSFEEKMIVDLYDNYLEEKQENTNLKQTLIDTRKILTECKLLMSHEFDWEEQVDNILQIIDKGLGEDKE